MPPTKSPEDGRASCRRGRDDGQGKGFQELKPGCQFRPELRAGTKAMFEIGWTEMLVIAVVMIVVVGPKDLPKMLRTFGKTTAKLRSMAGDFQKQFNEALKEAELDDVKKSVDSCAASIRRPRSGSSSIRSRRPRPMSAPASTREGDEAEACAAAAPAAGRCRASAVPGAEPLKNGATAILALPVRQRCRAGRIPATHGASHPRCGCRCGPADICSAVGAAKPRAARPAKAKRPPRRGAAARNRPRREAPRPRQPRKARRRKDEGSAT